jgi:hypothetical protein
LSHSYNVKIAVGFREPASLFGCSVTILYHSPNMHMSVFHLIFCSASTALLYNIDTIKENTKALIDASMEIGREVSTEKSKYMLMSNHQKCAKVQIFGTENNKSKFDP